MKNLRLVSLIGLILLYSFFFLLQEREGLERKIVLQPAMPVSFYTIATGYLQQLAAELLFIRTSVFLGGVLPGTPETTYQLALGNNFDVMTRLYPHFLDPYYFCQAFLPHISPEAAQQTSMVLETGIKAYPEDQILRFFYASNFFLAMNEPLKAAEAFTEAAKLSNAPPMFGHIAALLSAQGGDIAAGLISLKVLLEGEKDEGVRKRYQEEIGIFEKAMRVNEALKAYTAKNGTSPESLEQLVPGFLPKLPEIHDSFTLVYEPPNLHLRRPDKRKNAESGIPWK